MGELFKGTGYTFISRDENDNIEKLWRHKTVRITTRVVCEPCNIGWMSKVESLHAKPAMSDLIVGNPVALSQSRANSLAIFAFKTAVVVDYMRREEPFFSRSIRHKFANSLEIPGDVSMWLMGSLRMGGGRVDTRYCPFSIEPPGSLSLYVCTYSVGHLVFQVVAANAEGIPSFRPVSNFKHLPIPFWPELPGGVLWPPSTGLRNGSEFLELSNRWSTVGW